MRIGALAYILGLLLKIPSALSVFFVPSVVNFVLYPPINGKFRNFFGSISSSSASSGLSRSKTTR